MAQKLSAEVGGITITNIVNRNELQAQIYPPFRGLNTYDPPHHLPEGQGAAAYNVVTSAPNSICKRGGFQYLNTASFGIGKITTGTIQSITGLIVYGSGTNWTNTISANDCLFMKGNSSPIFWKIASIAGSATMTLAVAYTQTVTGSSYFVSPSQVDGLFKYKYGTTQKLMAISGSDAYYYGSGQFTKTGAALTAGSPPSAITFLDYFVLANGYQFKYYNGSTWANISGSPAPSLPLYLGVYSIGNANFLCAMGSLTDADKSQFAFSDVNSISTWPAANIYYAGDRDGAKLTGGKPISGGWAIFKEYSIYVFSGIPGSGQLRKIIDNVGCIAPKTLVSHKNWVYFLGRDAGKLHVFRFNGSTLEKLSQNIEPTLDNIDSGNAQYAVGEIYKDRYRLSITIAGGSLNTKHFDCYIDRPFMNNNVVYYPWFEGNRGVNALLSYEDGDTIALYSGSTTNNTTAAINAYGDTGWLDFGDNSRKKELLRTYIDATESGDWDLVFSLYFDFQLYGSSPYTINLGSSSMLWSEVVYGLTAWQSAVDKSITELNINYPGAAKHFKFRWSNSNASETFEVFPASIYYKLESR
jgi:hypothetical protein